MLQGYLGSLLEGARLTVGVALSSLAVATLTGLAAATARLSASRFWRSVATAYTTVIRGVPDLVLMLLIFYGGQLAVNAAAASFGHDDYIDVDPFFAGVTTLGVIFGAYLAETFRGAILAISPGQAEAARAFGFSSGQVLRRIVWPQMVRLALPSFANNWLVLVKSTALVSVIGLDDMMHTAGMAAGSTHRPFTFYLAVAVLYLAITSVSVVLLRLLERRYSAGAPARRHAA